MGTATTLRERKKARTREALIDTAMVLFRRHGFESTTVDEIVAPVEVSRRTFFRYFPTKEAVAFPHHADQLAHFRRLLDEHRDDANPIPAIRAAALGLATEFMRERDALVAQQRVVDASPSLIAYERELDLEWEQSIAEALTPRRAGAREVRRARVLAGATIGAFRATLRDWFATDGKQDLVKLGAETVESLELGFARRKGRR